MTSGRPEGLRLFVACPISEDVRRGLARIQDELQRSGARLRWARPEGIHITLKFLGQVEASRVDAITSALRDAVAPFELKLGIDSLGGFGGARLRVVWAGLQGDVEPLVRLAARIDSALAAPGFPREQRPFSPHITLGRVRDDASADERRRLARLIEGHGLLSLPPMIVAEVHLMRSRLGPGGSVYERLAAFPQGCFKVGE